jgi:hypothetical protein
MKLDLLEQHTDAFAEEIIADFKVTEGDADDLYSELDQYCNMHYAASRLFAEPFVVEVHLPTLDGQVEGRTGEEIEAAARAEGVTGEYEIDWYRGTYFDDESTDLTIRYIAHSPQTTDEVREAYKDSLMADVYMDALLFQKVVMALIEEGKLCFNPNPKPTED